MEPKQQAADRRIYKLIEEINLQITRIKRNHAKMRGATPPHTDLHETDSPSVLLSHSGHLHYGQTKDWLQLVKKLFSLEGLYEGA